MKRATCSKIIVIAVASLLALFYSSHDISAREGQMKFEQVLDVGKELTFTFMQDRDGFFWMGSATSGLLRFDGISVEYFKAGPGSVSDNNIVEIFEDSYGILWLATLGNGINSYDKRTDTFTYYKHDPSNPKTISSNSCNWIDGLILEDNEEFIWIGTADGLNRFDRKTKTFTRYKHDPDNPKSLSNNSIFTITEDRNGFLWIGTADGLNRFNKKTKTFTRYKHAPNKNSLGNNNIRTVYEDRDGFIWIGTEAVQLDKYDPNTDTFVNYRHDPVNPLSIPENMRVYSIYEDKNGRLFLTSAHNPVGYAVFDKQSETFTNYRKNSTNPGTLSSDAVVKFYEDRQGVLWASNLMGAIDRYDMKSLKFKTYANIPNDSSSLKGNTVINLYEDTQGTVWVGTFTGGLNKFDKKTETFEHFEHDPNDPKTIRNPYNVTNFEDSSGTFWVSSFENLSIFDREKGYCSLHTDVKCVYEILEDSDNPNILWLGTFKYGLYKYFRDSNTFVQYLNEPDTPLSLSNNIPIALYEDRDDPNILWVGTLGGGLDRFDKSTETFTNYKHEPDNPNSLSSNSIWDIYVDIRGNFWIATSDGGLNLFDKDKGTFLKYTTQNGFPSDNVLTILADDNGSLWMGTNIGLVKFNPETGKNRLYNENDGLISDSFMQFAKLKSADGELWFGGPKGVVRFHPDKIRDNEFIPPVHLTSLSQGGDKMRLGKAFEKVREIELDWQNNYFEFEYVALNYTHPEKNKYRYILEGLDKDWYNAGTIKHGRYSGLPGGTYTLKIQGSNNDGLWNEEGTAITVRVVPPFWRTFLFYIFLGMIALAIALFVLFYLRKLRFEVSKRIHKEKALKESEEDFRVLFENNPVSCWLEDFSSVKKYFDNLKEKGVSDIKEYFRDHPKAVTRCAQLITIKDLNQATLDLHNAKSKEELLNGLENTFTQESYEVFQKEMVDIWNKKPQTTYDATLRTLDGSLRYVTMTYRVAPGHEETLTKVTVTLVDNTAKRNAENERNKLESRLRQAQKMEAIGTLAGGIAHDFNNLLYPIIGFAEMLKEDLPPDSSEHESAQEIFNAGKRGGELVKQILAFSRQSEHKMMPVRVQNVLKEVLKLSRSAVPTDIEIYQDVQTDCGSIMGDATQIHQVAMNLITNAYHAVQEKSGTISVNLKQIMLGKRELSDSTLEQGQYIMLSVSDTGSGIEPNFLGKIFEPYFTTKKKGKGTGLGLAVVFGIIKEHQGDIKVYSETGKGTIFKIYLPLIKKSGETVSADQVQKIRTGTERILLVDDEISVAKLESQMLSRFGYQVTAKTDCSEALNEFKANPDNFDLVITDMTMPIMTGDQFAREILSIKPDIPIIICTGFSERVNKEQAELIGVRGFLMKPVLKSEMARMVRKVLDEANIYKGN